MRKILLVFLVAATSGIPLPVQAQSADVATYLRDRGAGMPTSMFGTYIRKGELLFYPFFEYYVDNNIEYKPSELGYGLDGDFRGKYRASEGIFFIGYGVTEWLAVEMEAAVISARQEKAPDDPSPMPTVIMESGSGDVEGQIRLRLMKESERRPELFSFFEAVSPQQKRKVLIGTPDWELKAGFGVIRGFSWGTMTARLSAEYTLQDSQFGSGEYAIEYLRRISRAWRVYGGIEGIQDEISLVTEAQWQLANFAFLKLNNAFGITSKATDWAPEIGIVFSVPTVMGR